MDFGLVTYDNENSTKLEQNLVFHEFLGFGGFAKVLPYSF